MTDPMTPPAAAQLLPPRRSEGAPYRLAVVCLGNICRSPMAHVVLERRIDEAGLGNDVEVVSAGTGDWHVGHPMDRRAAAVLTAAGYDASRHRAQQFADSWFGDCDLVLAMDASNLADITTLMPATAERGRVRMFRDFDPRADADRDVPDPYYGGDDGFDSVLAMVERTAAALVACLAHEVAGD
ncbi:MAG TPA: low molecular weight protein-tyrosine-phosphatase [Nocardioidaceae bacterium]|nr:low molecular weight protein-tyrosine-phosphatase [Nocardioidaceae bacterium]